MIMIIREEKELHKPHIRNENVQQLPSNQVPPQGSHERRRGGALEQRRRWWRCRWGRGGGGDGRGAWGGVGCRKRRLTYGLCTLLFVYLLSAPLRGASPF